MSAGISSGSSPNSVADHAVVLPVGVALLVAQPPHVLVVDQQRRVDDRGEDPQQQHRVVGGVRRAGREAPGGLGQLAAHAAVHGADAPGQAVGLGARAERDRVHHLGGAGQPLVGLVERAGVGEEAREGDRMGRLEQQRPRARHADRELAMDPADHRGIGEVAGLRRHLLVVRCRRDASSSLCRQRMRLSVPARDLRSDVRAGHARDAVLHRVPEADRPPLRGRRRRARSGWRRSRACSPATARSS